MSGGAAAQRMGVIGVELRQLRYFVTLAEELHFGRAAAREHIVQSALSQQLQRLERELGVRLLERSTHHVSLTAAGAVFLTEARQLLAHADRAAGAARNAATAAATLRVGIIDASVFGTAGLTVWDWLMLTGFGLALPWRTSAARR